MDYSDKDYYKMGFSKFDVFMMHMSRFCANNVIAKWCMISVALVLLVVGLILERVCTGRWPTKLG